MSGSLAQDIRAQYLGATYRSRESMLMSHCQHTSQVSRKCLLVRMVQLWGQYYIGTKFPTKCFFVKPCPLRGIFKKREEQNNSRKSPQLGATKNLCILHVTRCSSLT